MKNHLRVAFFLAYRQVKHASKWTTGLIMLVMVLVFLQLTVVSGVLVGLIQSSVDAAREKYSGDVLVSNLRQKSFIENSGTIINVLDNLPQVETYTSRVLAGGKLNADYKKVLRDNETPNEAAGNVSGIDPLKEDEFAGLSKYVIAGNYLDEKDTDGVLIGAFLINDYTQIDSPGLKQLRGIEIGQKLKLEVGNNSKEVVVRGVMKSKLDEIDARILMNQRELRKLIGRSDTNLDEISIKLKPGATDAEIVEVKEILVQNGFEKDAKIQTYEEAQPKFLKDITAVFALLGNMIGSIGLAVASITVFIVVFVNAITRRKFIGILKGIGIHPRVIEWSYVMQSVFYAVVGSTIGVIILYGLLVPFVDANPINFPFSDGIIYAPVSGTIARAVALFIASVIAGYIPARMIVKRNTLDAILGR
jgi:ABC-type lipoprotein release transport system permease subunit